MARIKYYDAESGEWKYADQAHSSDSSQNADYVLTESDKAEIAELAAELVEVPEGKDYAEIAAVVEEYMNNNAVVIVQDGSTLQMGVV